MPAALAEREAPAEPGAPAEADPPLFDEPSAAPAGTAVLSSLDGFEGEPLHALNSIAQATKLAARKAARP